ncbi:uncharacterized protein LOC114263697 [Camellia sinensis]|uniref:uncharacterized protein LOC114263697 n=1 Tax=Camellia sinensis TaxID=4442 RepID=UPI001035F0B8|nr:uncharacterized protein LOC114263697 [Camellia sinensis]
MNHDYPDTSNLRHVQQQNRERRRLYLQQRRQRSASERNAQTEQPQREFEQLRLQNLSTEQRSARLEQRRLAQRRRRLFIREESATSNVQQREIQRESWRNYARQRRAALTIEQREQQLARRRTNYRQRRQISENIEQTSHPNQVHNMTNAQTSRNIPHVDHDQDAFSDEDIPDNRSFIHRSYHNCARNFHETERFQRMQFPAPTTCRHCNARLFHRETSTMCCNNGTIILPPVTAPNEIIDIFSDQTVEGRHFRQNIRAYNHVFSFTSMGVHVDENLATRTRSVYTFRAQGAIYHKIGSLLPNSSDRPRYLQLYVYDTDHENENRMSENEELHLDLLDKIKNILNTHNPFVHTFRQLAQRLDIHECRLQIKEQPRNRPQYNLPTAPEVAAVLVGGEEAGNLKPRDIIVQSTSGHLLNISDIVEYYDPLQYPLLLPYSSYGWDVNTRNNDSRKVTCCDFYSYMLQIRPGDQSLFLRGGRLLQQYVVDNYVKIESNKLRWIRTHQNHIRADFYQGLLDTIHAGENYGGNVGRRTILPSSFVGSPRDMYQRYQDAMALVQKYGKPDLFLTMTCNPNWPEIKAELLPGQSPHDRPDLLTRIFHSKFDEMKTDILTKHVLGKVLAYAYVIEYQKRGLPHARMVIILDENDKLRTPDDYDNIVRAEIPDKRLEPRLCSVVLKHMIHGPCGMYNERSPCMTNGRCKRRFPKPFCSITTLGNDSYPIYRRREGESVPLESNPSVLVDNSWVIPYNPWLLLKYDCHINLEICSSVTSMKYLYKYVYKGPDRVALEVRQGPNYDEVQQFIDGRWFVLQKHCGKYSNSQ